MPPAPTIPTPYRFGSDGRRGVSSRSKGSRAPMSFASFRIITGPVEDRLDFLGGTVQCLGNRGLPLDRHVDHPIEHLVDDRVLRDGRRAVHVAVYVLDDPVVWVE